MQVIRSQKPISPQQMFHKLINQSYRESQCQDQSVKLKKQRQILLQLIVEYQKSIESQLMKINDEESIQRFKLQKLDQLQRLRRERLVIQQEINAQFNRLIVKKQEQNQKLTLISELQQVRFTNSKLKVKLRDLADYVQKLEIHNRKLQDQKNIVQSKIVNQMKVNSDDWRYNVEMLRKKQEVTQNQLRAKILNKETQNINFIRRQEEQINQRNIKNWEDFRKIANKPSVIPLSIPTISPVISEPYAPYVSRRLPLRNFDRFRVI